MKGTISMLSGVLVIIAFVPYILAIVRKTTKPAKASWIIWAVLDTVTFAGMYVKGSLNYQIIAAVIGVWIVVVLALIYGKAGWTKLDVLCLSGAVLGIILWILFKEALFGIMTAQAVLFLGAFPTFASSWKKPEDEDKIAWTLFWLSCVCAVSAIPKWTIADAAQPITFFVIESTMMFILFVRPLFVVKRISVEVL